MTPPERRERRSQEPFKALCFQLDTSRIRADLDALVLVDDEGLCVASSGDAATCEEVAAHVALIGERVPCFDGVLFSERTCWEIYMEQVSIAGARLYVCAVGGHQEARTQETIQSRNGVTRILAAA